MSRARARYRATRPAAAPAKKPATGGRWRKRLVVVALLVGYAAVLWYLVFPWVDRTFVNRPAL